MLGSVLRHGGVLSTRAAYIMNMLQSNNYPVMRFFVMQKACSRKDAKKKIAKTEP